jgi:glycosyltransferase involved in cell wall biosynthesis
VQHSVTAKDGDEEGLPVAIIEAAASGLPIVATNHSGIPEIVIDGVNGFLVEEHDFESMGKKIADLAEQPELWVQMGLRGRAHVEGNMNMRKQAISWIDLFKRIVGTKPRARQHVR